MLETVAVRQRQRGPAPAGFLPASRQSGQESSALAGIHSLKQWKTQANGKLVILPGGGINADNCLQFKALEFEWVHLSAKKAVDDLPNSLFSAPQYGLDVEALNKVIALLKP